VPDPVRIIGYGGTTRASAAEEDLRTLGCRACHLSFASISNPQVTALQRATGSHTDSTTGFNTPAAGDNRDLDQAGISASLDTRQ
jgi:hypothetical protein